jgi:hypothetical protein
LRNQLLPIASVVSVAIAARLLQLLLSSLPLNIDSFAQVVIARELLSSGQWVLDEASTNSYNLKMPGLPLLLAATSALLADDPIVIATPFMIIVSLVGILGFYALAYRLTGRREVAVTASFVLALLGPYIFLGATLIKEALALALLPIIVWLTLRRRDRRMRAMATSLLLLLPLIHHLSTLMAYGFVTLIILLDNVRNYWEARWSWRSMGWDLLLGPGLLPFTLWYYTYVRLEFFTEVWNPNDVALFLSTGLLMATAAVFLTSERRARPWFALSKSRLLPSLLDQKVVTVLGAFLLVIANLYRPVFPGTTSTSPLLLVAATAYVPMTLLAVVGLNLFRLDRHRRKALAVALLLAPLTAILYALLRGLDPVSHVLLYRSVDFLDYGLALCIGAALFRGMPRSRRTVLLALMGASLLLTLPMAYATEEVFEVQNVTYEYELLAMGWLSESSRDDVRTNQRIGDILSMYFGIRADRSLPLDLARGRPLATGSILLLETTWGTRGAQMHPQPFLPVGEENLERLLQNNQLLYHGGGPWNGVYVVEVRG